MPNDTKTFRNLTAFALSMLTFSMVLLGPTVAQDEEPSITDPADDAKPSTGGGALLPNRDHLDVTGVTLAHDDEALSVAIHVKALRPDPDPSFGQERITWAFHFKTWAPDNASVVRHVDLGIQVCTVSTQTLTSNGVTATLPKGIGTYVYFGSGDYGSSDIGHPALAVSTAVLAVIDVEASEVRFSLPFSTLAAAAKGLDLPGKAGHIERAWVTTGENAVACGGTDAWTPGTQVDIADVWNGFEFDWEDGVTYSSTSSSTSGGSSSTTTGSATSTSESSSTSDTTNSSILNSTTNSTASEEGRERGDDAGGSSPGAPFWLLILTVGGLLVARRRS